MKYKKVTDLNEVRYEQQIYLQSKNPEHMGYFRVTDFDLAIIEFRAGNLYIEDDTPEPEVVEVVEMWKGNPPVTRVPLNLVSTYLDSGWRVVKTKVVDYEI